MATPELINVSKIIGVVADVRRDLENDYGCNKCCIFGISRIEYETITKKFRIVPTQFSEEYIDRYVVNSNPWSIMRIMGENFGYILTVTPLQGRIEGPTGERRTCIWTMVSSSRASKPNPNS